MKPGHLQRGLTLLVLVLIFADLMSPQLCCEELKFSSSADISATVAHKEEHAEEKEKGESSVITLDEEAREKIDLTLESAQYRTTSQIIQITGAVGPNQTRLAHMRPLARGRIEIIDHIIISCRILFCDYEYN